VIPEVEDGVGVGVGDAVGVGVGDWELENDAEGHWQGNSSNSQASKPPEPRWRAPVWSHKESLGNHLRLGTALPWYPVEQKKFRLSIWLAVSTLPNTTLLMSSAP
jgi:hypothetical protein